MKKNQGFTLIELMIVIAIIAILMAYAIPAYRDYTVRAKAGEAISIASAAKQSVSETFISEGTWPADNASAGLAASTAITGTNVESVEVGAPGAGQITITFNAADAALSGSSIVLTPASTTTAGSIEWECGTALDFRYVPAECRNAPGTAP